MNCRRAKHWIPLYAGGELSGKIARRLARHLEGCPDCRNLAGEFQAVLSGYPAAVRRDELDWPEAEWANLMERIVTQSPPRRLVFLKTQLRTAWVYGAAAFFLLAAFSAIILRTGLLRRSSPLPQEILAWTEIPPGRSLEFTGDRLHRPWRDGPYGVQTEQPRLPEKQTLAATGPRVEISQDIVSMTLVSQETGLKVHWTFNRNFEWKEEAKR